MSYSVVVLKSVAAQNVGSLNKTGKHATVALENGHVVVLGDKSTARGDDDVFKVTTPATASLTTDTFYMVYDAPAAPELGGKYRISSDPRDYNIAAGKEGSIYRPMVGDEIAISVDGVGGTKGGNVYVSPVDAATKMEWVANTTSASLVYELLGDTFIPVGNTRVDAYHLMCVKA